jgi:predicted AAA+ superfamily ATPase
VLASCECQNLRQILTFGGKDATIICMYARKIALEAARLAASPVGRITVFTGARQTGKTTLVKACLPDYTYLSIEDPVLRPKYKALTAQQWKTLYPLACLDEVQKEPALVESIKSVYDQWDGPRYLLLGSSQLLLMQKVRESLAGRCSIIELYPLTLPELETPIQSDGTGMSAVHDSPLQTFLQDTSQVLQFLPDYQMAESYAENMRAFEYYCRFGGYPALTNPALSDAERYIWLSNYVRTYLERDIRDFINIRDLEPVVLLQRFLANNTGVLLNASVAANELGISVKTVQRYIRCLEMGYQLLLLPAWSRNLNKRLSRTPKIHYLDQGVLQGVLEKQGGMTGHEFESLVCAEIYKQVKTIHAAGQFYHLRTNDGFEVDLLIERPEGYIAFEIKMAEKIRPSDAAPLMKVEAFLDKPLLHGFLLSRDTQAYQFGEKVTAVHASYLLG